VPRSWALVWLAQAHQEPPIETAADWRERWAAEADRYGQGPPPTLLLDPADLVKAEPDELIEDNAKTAERALTGALEVIGRDK
jgi:hypothetical protein